MMIGNITNAPTALVFGSNTKSPPTISVIAMRGINHQILPKAPNISSCSGVSFGVGIKLKNLFAPKIIIPTPKRMHKML